MRTIRSRSSIEVGGGAILLATIGLACNLEAALGVDGDGGESADGATDATTESVGSGDPESSDTDVTETDGASAGSSGEPEPEPEPPSVGCVDRHLRVATFNVQGVDGQQTASHDALVSVVQRIDADILCLQEVVFYEDDELSSLALQAGYTRVIQSNEPPAIGGDLTNACLSRAPMTIEGSYSGGDLGTDPGANDVGRDILVVRADLSSDDEPCGLGVVTLHLKSGQEPLDWFRRQMEAQRVAQAVQRYRTEHPGEPIVIMGDLNETIDDPALGHVFPGIPSGLPSSYRVGSDIEFPLTYQPFETLRALGFREADATQEDTVGAYETWADIVRLDYVLYDEGLQLEADEVYNACRDNGVDDAPTGNWVPKQGAALSCPISEQASDHFPVLADLIMR
ncbi:MAG: endonuclease/exonuclease/phosphatase family protein [Myxococcota bacterium]